jgi:phosphoribosylformylglycinamidine synthase
MSFFYRIFRTPFLSEARSAELIVQLAVFGIEGVVTERVFCIESSKKLSTQELDRLRWLLGGPDRDQCLSDRSFLGLDKNVLEIGPRLHFETANSTNAVSICQACGLTSVIRLEEVRRYRFASSKSLDQESLSLILPILHDKMTECPYPDQLTTFETDKKPEPVKYIPVMEEGIEALRKANAEYGTGMDEVDINYYFHLFYEVAKRNPTDVEWCDLGNANCEHSRHHVFGAKLIIDGKPVPFTLMELIKGTLTNIENSIIAFHDNASAIRGVPVRMLIPNKPGLPSEYRMAELLLHYVLTCETHNHPCLWSAFAGAGTGGGGRRRDGEAPGRGGRLAASSAGFIGGNLYIPGDPLPWENPDFQYDPLTESPLDFFLNAVQGAFSDGNQFGEPVIATFFRSFGLDVGGERWENIKPIMFSGGFSFIDDFHTKKNTPEPGWLMVKIGGKAFEIGFGGGAASSMMQGQNIAALDFRSVQRADGEMANKVNRVIIACINMGENNPIEVIHDQGAGGPGNVLKEIMIPTGGKVDIQKILLGDKTMAPVAIWVSEFQENIAVLIKPERWAEFEAICIREKCPVAVVGAITGDHKAVVIDSKTGTTLVDLELDWIFGNYPQKTYEDTRRQLDLKPLVLPKDLSVRQALERTFRLLGVCSQEWATQLVDRAVTPFVAQQQCVGPNLEPISPYSVIAPSPFAHVGEANSIGLRPEIGLISPQASARMAAAEALLNLMFVPVSARNEIKASINWMLAAKLPGGIAWLYDAALALHNFFNLVEMDADGGKDSLSLAAQVGEERIRSLSTLVVSTYAACPDSRLRLQPYFKKPGQTNLMFVDLAKGQTRLGGSALAQVYKQVGNVSPDADDPALLTKAFDLVQKMLKQKGLLVSGHRRGRNGLMSTLCESAFAGNCGLAVNLEHSSASAIEMLFNEELGFVLEYLPENEEEIFKAFAEVGLADCTQVIGKTYVENRILIGFNGKTVLDETMPNLRALWRETSFQMKSQIAVKSCVEEERSNTRELSLPPYNLTFEPDEIPMITTESTGKIPVAVIREEGTNSDQEMVMAAYLAGFEPYDVTLTDLASGRISLKVFRGIFFPGGFSYKDVLGSATGFAGVIKFNELVAQEFADFFARQDTFSLGICNGAQLGVLLGIPWPDLEEKKRPRLVTNESEVFESRFPSVTILDSPAMMLNGMVSSILGVHLDHGEGQFVFPDESVMNKILAKNQAPIRFVDDQGLISQRYPFNPNGSVHGIAGVCSEDGRHLYMMPHPERTVLIRQWHYWPNGWEHFQNSPWLKMFQNAYAWCIANS